jgi:tetratricopeptide (TPR) repeat protein
MLDTKTPHLDDFTLLRFVAWDLEQAERTEIEGHLDACPTCKATLHEIEELNRELSILAKDHTTQREWEAEDLPEGDPFRRRPLAAGPSRHLDNSSGFAKRAVAASEEGTALSASILEAAKGSPQELEAEFGSLDLSDPACRFALLYALQKAGVAIAECPGRFLAFAEQTLRRLRTLSPKTPVDALIPDAALFAQARQLAGQACLWSGELERAGSCFSLAYRFFEQLGDELGLAKVEQLESQRRFFTGNGGEALILARRAARTAELLGVEDEQARARVAEGMALFELSRWRESLEAFREALPVFERLELWSNYVGALNCIGNALVKLNRLDEARREYARALRRISRERHRSWVPFIRKGLAEILFSAGRYREAAVTASQAARLYSASGQVSRSLMTCLFEVESWARAGDLSRARHRLELFQSEVARRGVLDPTVDSLIAAALSGDSPDFRNIAELRRTAEQTLKHHFGEMNA